MTAASLTARYNDLKNQVSAVILAGYQQTFNDSFWTTWINGGTGRITPFLTQARAYGLWPTTQAPIVSPFGGTIGTGSSVTLVNPNGVGTLYYTTNGTDPRAPGGGIQGSTYSGAIAIPQPVTLKARVRSTTGEWSPLAEADFAPPPARILFTELNYNPPGSGDDTEFLELANVGGVVASLNGAHFTEGIDYTFGNITLNPGQRIVLVSNPAAFSTAYPGVTVGGTYAGNLSNSGETVTLRDIAEAVICTVTYGDSNAAGWPADPDGEGSSLVLKRPSALLSAAALNDPASWRRSAQPNPAGIDGIALTAPDPLADADKDGFSALVEYVAGTSDADGAAGPGLTISLDASGYTLVSLTHPAGTDDAMLEAFESTALGGWTAMPLVEESWNGPAGTVTSTWRCAQPTAANQRTFLRLKATRL